MKTKKVYLYRKNNPYFTGDTFYNRYVSSQILEDVKNNKPIQLTGFTCAELELITKHANAKLWENMQDNFSLALERIHNTD